MSMSLAPSGIGGEVDRPGDRAALPLGVAVLASSVALVVWQARFRVSEAWFMAMVMRLFHVRGNAASLGDNVVFPLRGRWVGISLNVACTAALLLVPFFAVAGILMLVRRVPSARALVALAITTTVIVAVNQLRLLLIVGSMVAWGFQRGYERSHIFLGTMLSTVGVIVGVILFVWLLIGNVDRRRIRGGA